ncbi:transposase [Crocosphaera sp. UHCC 0190]|nr:transposase [Crocosphaera sp. UHCC 0190]MEA5511019.1 transposase [Crocosphaera sp. UHCC 0190]
MFLVFCQCETPKFHQRRVSRKKKDSTNRKKAINQLGRKHLKISRQREEHAKRLARCVIQSNDLVALKGFCLILQFLLDSM